MKEKDSAAGDLLGRLIENPALAKTLLSLALHREKAEDACDTPCDGASCASHTSEACEDAQAKEGVGKKERDALIAALIPFLSHEKQERMQTLLKILHFVDLAGQLGLFHL